MKSHDSASRRRCDLCTGTCVGAGVGCGVGAGVGYGVGCGVGIGLRADRSVRSHDSASWRRCDFMHWHLRRRGRRGRRRHRRRLRPVRRSIGESKAHENSAPSPPLGENAAVLTGTSGTRPQRHVVELASRRWRYASADARRVGDLIYTLALASARASGPASEPASASASAAASASAYAQINQ